MDENNNITHQIHAAKAVFRGKIIALSILMFKIKYSIKQSNIKICIRKGLWNESLKVWTWKTKKREHYNKRK